MLAFAPDELIEYLKCSMSRDSFLLPRVILTSGEVNSLDFINQLFGTKQIAQSPVSRVYFEAKDLGNCQWVERLQDIVTQYKKELLPKKRQIPI